MAAPSTYFFTKTPGVDYLLRPVPSGFNQTTFTFASWIIIPLDYTPEYVDTVFAIYDDDDGGYPAYEAGLYIWPVGAGHYSGFDEGLHFRAYIQNGNYVLFFNYPGSLPREVPIHVVFHYDSSNADAAERIRFYANGVRLAYYIQQGTLAQNQEIAPAANYPNPQYVFSSYTLGVVEDEDYGVGEYAAKLYYGQALFVSGSNVSAEDIYGGTLPSSYGAAGFLLDFATPETIELDSSGNNNHFTLFGSELDSWYGKTPVFRSAAFQWNLDFANSVLWFADASSCTHIWGAVDATQFSDFLSSFLLSQQNVTDALSLVDAVAYAYPLLSSDSIALTSPVAQILRAALSVTTSVRLTSPIDMQRIRAMDIATALVLRDALGTVKHFDELINVAEFADLVVDQIVATADVIEQLLIESQASDYLVIFTASSDAFAFADTAAQFSSVFDHVGDTINFFGSLGLDNEDYMVWAVHTQYPAATEYQNYEFNSFAQVGNVYLGAADDGIYELSGSDDAGADIAAVVRTGLFDFGSAQLKQVVRAYLGYTSEHRLVLKTIATDGGAKVERWYELREKPADEVRESRIKLGKGVKSRYWQFELVNVDGGEFEVDQLHLMPVMLSRRVKE